MHLKTRCQSCSFKAFAAFVLLCICIQNVALAAGPGYHIEPVIDPSGDPFFPIGWWWGPADSGFPDRRTESAFREMASGGANTIYVANNPSFARVHHDKYLRVAQKYDLKLIFMIPSRELAVANRSNAAHDARIIEAIEFDIKHPGFLGFSAGDEHDNNDGPPNPTEPAIDQQEWFYQQVKSRNPRVMVLHSWGDMQPLTGEQGIDLRLPNVDTTAFFEYPILKGYPPLSYDRMKVQLSRTNSLARDSRVNRKRGLIHLAQGFGEEWPGKPPQRYPTHAEQRFLTWSAIVSNGQRGTIYFEFFSDWLGADHVPGFNKYFHEVSTPIMKEQRLLGRALETGHDVGSITTNHDEYIWTGTHTVRETGTLLVRDEMDYYLIVTNNTEHTNLIELSMTDLPTTLRNGTAQVLNEQTKVTIKNEGKGRFKINSTMTTCDVNIFHFQGATSGEL